MHLFIHYLSLDRYLMIKVIGFQRMKKCNEGGGTSDFKRGMIKGEGRRGGKEERTNKFHLNLNQIY